MFFQVQSALTRLPKAVPLAEYFNKGCCSCRGVNLPKITFLLLVKILQTVRKKIAAPYLSEEAYGGMVDMIEGFVIKLYGVIVGGVTIPHSLAPLSQAVVTFLEKIEMCLHTSKFVCFPAFEKNPIIFNYILLPEDDSIGET